MPTLPGNADPQSAGPGLVMMLPAPNFSRASDVPRDLREAEGVDPWPHPKKKLRCQKSAEHELNPQSPEPARAPGGGSGGVRGSGNASGESLNPATY